MKNFKLTIPEPCHEDWNKMLPDAQGKFCLSCQKSVIDFTKYTDEQLIEYFTIYKDEKTCGRVLATQLDKTYTINLNNYQYNWTFQKIFLFSFILIFGIVYQADAKDVMDNTQVKLMIADTTIQVDSSLSDTMLYVIEMDSTFNNDTNEVLIGDTINTQINFDSISYTDNMVKNIESIACTSDGLIVLNPVGNIGYYHQNEENPICEFLNSITCVIKEERYDLILQKHTLRVNKFVELVNEFYYIPIENKKIKTEVNEIPKTKFAPNEKNQKKLNTIKENILAVLPSKKRKRRKK